MMTNNELFEAYEKLKKSNISATLKSLGLFLGLTLASFGILYFFVDDIAQLVTFGILVVIVFGVLTLSTKDMFKKDISKFVREEVYQPLYKDAFGDVILSANGFSQAQILKSKMLVQQNSFSSNTFIQLNMKDYRVKMSNVTLQSLNKHGEVSSTQFKGRWYIFDRMDVQSPYVQVTTDASNAKTSKIGHELQFVETESIQFNSMFSILSESELSAFEVLQPHIMEEIISMKNELGDKSGLMMACSEDRFYIGVEHAGEFAALHADVLSDDYIESIKEDIKTTKIILDHVSRILKINM